MSHGHAWAKPVDPKRVDLTVRIGSLELRNPVLTASGTFGYGDEYAHIVDLELLDALALTRLCISCKEKEEDAKRR